MAKAAGQVTLRGRFPVGAVVTLTRVDGEHVLRPEGGEDVEVKTVGEEDGAPRVGFVRFSKGVEVGARYFIHGLNDGVPLNVRVTGRAKDDPDEVLSQPPIMPDRTRFSDGSFVDSAPTKETAPDILAAQADIRHARKGTVLRSDTPRGEAHPVDVEAQEPVRRQEDVNGPVQMSDTPAGEATELVVGPQRQEDVPGSVVQRSSTPTGVAQPLPSGDAIQQAQDRESSAARESRGDFARAGAEPLVPAGRARAGGPKGASQEQSEKRDAELKASEREAALASPPTDQPADAQADTSGTDAMGQPVAEDVARAAGVTPADDESERRSEAAKKAARTRKRNERKAAARKSPVRKAPAKPAAKQEQGSKSSGPVTGAATTSNTTAKE